LSENEPQGPRPAEAIARDSGVLGSLWRQGRRLQALSHLVRSALGEPLAAHVSVLALRGGVLSLAADSAAVASELRFETPALSRALDGLAAFQGLVEVRIRVVPRAAPADEPRRLAGEAAAAIQRTLPGIRDAGLRAALAALAAHARRT
jgi:hypothetical protein